MGASREPVTSCLFCVSDCSASSALGLEMAGAVFCQKLEKQLQNLFVLRNILDLDLTWCMNTLQARATQDQLNSHVKLEEGEGQLQPGSTTPKPRGDLEHWFQLCQSCTETVAQAWEVHQRLLTAQFRMNQIKEEMKKRMRESWVPEPVPGDGEELEKIDDEIRKLVCRDLGNVDSDVPTPPRRKRKRGRPFGSGKKNKDSLNLKEVVSEPREIGTQSQCHVQAPFSPSKDGTCQPVTIDIQKIEIETQPVFTIDEASNPASMPSPSNASSTLVDLYPFIDASSSTSSSNSSDASCYSPPGSKISRRPPQPKKRKPGGNTKPGGNRRPGRPPKKRGPSDPPSKRKPTHEWVKCPHCDTRYKSTDPEKLEQHLSLHAKSEAAGGGEFDCPQCSFPAQDCLELDLHFRKRHIYTMVKNKIWHKCPKCEFKSHVFKRLREHADSQHGGKVTDEELGQRRDFQCDLCSRKFTTGRSLQRHKRCQHPEAFGVGEEEVGCPHCDLRFTSKLSLQAHINNSHRSQNPQKFKLQCNFCGRGFENMSRLSHHQLSHTRLTKREHVCGVCGVNYAYKETLSKHLKDFHPDAGQNANDANTTTVAKLSCRYCEFTTPFKPALMKHHSEVHKAGFGHKCVECGKYYTSAQGLRRHLKINHSDVEVACPYCNKKFVSIEYLKNHLKRYCKLKELKERQDASQETIVDGMTLAPPPPPPPPPLMSVSEAELKQDESSFQYRLQT